MFVDLRGRRTWWKSLMDDSDCSSHRPTVHKLFDAAERHPIDGLPGKQKKMRTPFKNIGPFLKCDGQAGWLTDGLWLPCLWQGKSSTLVQLPQRQSAPAACRSPALHLWCPRESHSWLWTPYNTQAFEPRTSPSLDGDTSATQVPPSLSPDLVHQIIVTCRSDSWG